LHIRFLAGMGVALIINRWTLPAPRASACAGAAIFVGAGLIDSYYGPLSPLQQTVGYTLGSALTLAGLVQAERSGLIAPPDWLVYLGNASYAIYLVHFLALSVLAKGAKAVHLDAFLPGGVLFLLHVIGAIAVGILFHHFVEHPLHVWARRIFRPEKLAASALPSPIRQAA
jgi:peptidoglycan/LPS O-acetylase OafA/YrhL